jgi:hypothetical protein
MACSLLPLKALPNNSSEDEYFQKPFTQHSFNRDTWKKVTDELDYADKRKNQPEEKEPHSTPPMFSLSEQTMRLVAFIILFAVLIIILFKAFGINIFPGKRIRKNETDFTIDEFDDHIPESELTRFLREALQRNNFKLAVRIYYLMAINELATKKLITWRKEKTNADYLLELRQAASYKEFYEMTMIFERVWYGERVIDAPHFRELSGRFEHFLSTLKAR